MKVKTTLKTKKKESKNLKESRDMCETLVRERGSKKCNKNLISKVKIK